MLAWLRRACHQYRDTIWDLIRSEAQKHMSESTPFGKTAVALAALAALALSSLATAQPEAPGEAVTIPGATVSNGSGKEVRGRYGRRLSGGAGSGH